MLRPRWQLAGQEWMKGRGRLMVGAFAALLLFQIATLPSRDRTMFAVFFVIAFVLVLPVRAYARRVMRIEIDEYGATYFGLVRSKLLGRRGAGKLVTVRVGAWQTPGLEGRVWLDDHGHVAGPWLSGFVWDVHQLDRAAESLAIPRFLDPEPLNTVKIARRYRGALPGWFRHPVRNMLLFIFGFPLLVIIVAVAVTGGPHPH